MCNFLMYFFNVFNFNFSRMSYHNFIMFSQKFYEIEMIINNGQYVYFITCSSLSSFDIGYIYYLLLLISCKNNKAENDGF